MVTDAEAMAEGEGPLAAREDGVAAIPKKDVHRLEEIWPAMLPQGNLPSGHARGVNHPLDSIGQPEGVEAWGIDDNEEL
jgi:hypothetical protein